MKYRFIPAVVVLAAGGFCALIAGMDVPTRTQDRTRLRIDDRWAGEPIPRPVRTSDAGSIILAEGMRSGAVCENANGERLAVFGKRTSTGHDIYEFYYSACPKGGSWAAPKPIGSMFHQYRPNSVKISVDRKGVFHCLWSDDEYEYARFANGNWSASDFTNWFGWGLGTGALAIRSNREVDVVQIIEDDHPTYRGLVLARRIPNSEKWSYSDFSGVLWPESASMAVDSRDHLWIANRGRYGSNVIHVGEGADIAGIRKFLDPDLTNLTAQIAVNSDSKVMLGISRLDRAASPGGFYMSRLRDPASGSWAEIPVALRSTKSGLEHSRLVSHGRDFYWAVLDGRQALRLMKFDEGNHRWRDLEGVASGPVGDYDMYPGRRQILITWSENMSPENVHLATVDVDPYYVQSAVNLKVEKRQERGFFKGYYFNILTWEPNPRNSDEGVDVTAFRIYRKERAADASAWTRLVAVTADVLYYHDKGVASNSDFVYAVTCVDADGRESRIE